MQDINGVELAVGDDVVYTNRNLNELHKGKVFKISKSKLIVKYQEDQTIMYGTPAKAYHYKYHHNIMSSDQVMKLG
jgi:hypothetical protein